MGLHLGWIPNEPGLRLREYDQAAPREPEPDPAVVAALKAAQHARGIWAPLLTLIGLFAVLLFGAVAAIWHVTWAWGAVAALALCCWWPVVRLALAKRRATARLRAETDRQVKQHATELEAYEHGKAHWERAEAERVATAPRWLQVAAHEDISRLDVFGGTVGGRRNLLTGLGWELLSQRAVIVLDLSQDRVADGLLAAAGQAGISCLDYRLPADLPATPLLAGMSADEVASLIVEVLHADDATATAAARATDLMVLKKITGVLDGAVRMSRLHAALDFLLTLGSPGGPGQHAAADGGCLSGAERSSLAGLFGAAFRQQVAGNLIRLAAVIEPLAGLGSDAASRRPARLTCLSLADGPRDVAADLTAALVVQWVTRAVSVEGSAAAGGFRPAIVVAGADEQSTRHLGRLTAVCERYDVPLVRTFSRLTEESARHLDTRHTAFLRLATRPEALRAAEHIGLERKFVAGRFSHSHSLSRSRTRTTSESVTHTTGRTEGEAVTRSTGTTTGQAYSESEVPRHDRDVHVHVHERDRDKAESRPREPRRNESGQDEDPGKAAAGGDRGQDKDKDGQRSGRVRQPDRRDSGSGSGNSGNSGKKKKPEIDIVKTRTSFTAQHESEAKTKSWSQTEETSHTTSTSRSRTDGVSVEDEITFELVYDHRVAPETLMTLAEDQMLAPHVVEQPVAQPAATAIGAATGTGSSQRESKIVALVIDPAVVGAESVAPVRPHEIPSFEPPAPAISGHVPDYERVPRPAISPS